MATSTSTLLSVREYLQLERREDGLKDELIRGEIVLSPSAKPLHAKVVANLFDMLKALQAQGYARATDFGCVLGEHSLPGPDLAVIRTDRWRSVGEDDYLIGSPELVVEVFSPSNRKALMAQKAALYLEHGAEAVWVVYPKTRTVIVHDAEGQREARCGETVSFQGVVVPVSAIFEGL
ncbi:MAG TPA: Uma2 family endonuclease [Bryobacteraceae bacterium]|jgi:Uma2 family endonuclease|nr:Uma2 family endonuclease [Bryobacteraceae bacterium]